jgi:hypothetical protein
MKPEAFQHRKVGRLSIWARWLWVGLLHHADDDGRFIADHGELLARFFGYDRDVTESKVGEWLAEVAATGLVILYTAEDGTPLGYFPDWHEHQRIDRPKPSTLPAPPPLPPRAATTLPPHATMRSAKRKGDRHRARKRAHPSAALSSEALPSTTDRRHVDDASTTDRRVDRIGSDRDLDLKHSRASGDAQPSAIEAEMLGTDNRDGHDPEPVAARSRPSRKLRSPSSALEGFADFWAVYPRKKDRVRAEKEWAKLAPDADLRARILADVERRKASEWRDCEPRYILHASTYLHGKRWTDEPDKPGADDRTRISERWAGVPAGKVQL